eukprot:scaffold4886_cov183-Skeletonema_dohrnii-CCMP3373.AAC.1
MPVVSCCGGEVVAAGLKESPATCSILSSQPYKLSNVTLHQAKIFGGSNMSYSDDDYDAYDDYDDYDV